MNRYAPLFEHASDAIALVEYHGDIPVICDANEVFQSIFDADESDLIGKDLDEVVASDAQRQHARRISQRVRNGELLQKELSRDTVDGRRDFRWQVIPVDGRDGDEINLAFTIYSDITDRKERQRELKRQNDRLEEFASMVSHDLRNPLKVAKGRLELAREETDTDHLEAVARAHDRMEGLIQDLLAIARKGEYQTDWEPVELARVVTACWETVPTNDASLKINSDGTIMADSGQIRQLLENLIRNAVAHGGERVTVRVGTHDSGFFVADDGEGIPSDMREEVFRSGHSTHAEGTGFGLAIVEQIAEAHQWDVQILESRNGGARFEFDNVEMV